MSPAEVLLFLLGVGVFVGGVVLEHRENKAFRERLRKHNLGD